MSTSYICVRIEFPPLWTITAEYKARSWRNVICSQVKSLLASNISRQLLHTNIIVVASRAIVEARSLHVVQHALAVVLDSPCSSLSHFLCKVTQVQDAIR